MKSVVIALLLVLVAGPLFAVDEGFDPAYIKTFGRGVILASNKGYPEFEKFDPAQVKFKDGVNYLSLAGEKKLDMRYILPEGVDSAAVVAKVKKDQPGNAKFQDGEDKVFFDIWVSHDDQGNPNFSDAKPWPAKVGDIPKWEPAVSPWYNLRPGSMTGGCVWEDMSSGLYDWLPVAKPGWKIWVSMSYGFVYKVGAGEVEEKWDSTLGKFVKVTSTGAMGFAKSAPVLATTIVFE